MSEESVYQIMKRRGVDLSWYEKKRGITIEHTPKADNPFPDLVSSIFGKVQIVCKKCNQMYTKGEEHTCFKEASK